MRCTRQQFRCAPLPLVSLVVRKKGVKLANNLFVSYDLIEPGQHYDDVIAEIKNLGNWAKVNYSLWYVNSELSPSEAAKRVWAVMDENDKLIVIDATTNNAAWHNLGNEVSEFIKDKWNK